MITKSKKAARTVFYVPLSEQGQQFLQAARKFLNSPAYKMRVLGRNEDRKGVAENTGLSHVGLRQTIPVRHATYAAIYLDPKLETRAPLGYWRAYDERNRKLQQELEEAKQTIEDLHGSLIETRDAGTEQIGELRKSLKAARDERQVLVDEVIRVQRIASQQRDQILNQRYQINELRGQVTQRNTWGAIWADVKQLLNVWSTR